MRDSYKSTRVRQAPRGGCVEKRKNRPEAQFIVPDWKDKVDYGIGLLCR